MPDSLEIQAALETQGSPASRVAWARPDPLDLQASRARPVQPDFRGIQDVLANKDSAGWMETPVGLDPLEMWAASDSRE